MNFVSPNFVRRLFAAASLTVAALPCLTGCSSDRPIDYQAARSDNGYPSSVTTAPTVATDLPSRTASSDSLSGEKDPLVQASGLDMGSPYKTSGDAQDPLSDAPASQNSDADPLERTNAAGSTDNSHWIRGTVADARMEIRLNGAFLTTVNSNIDLDITSKCHKGLNTVAFVYTPHGVNSYALIDVLESEHNPPIPPLVTFNSRDVQSNPSITSSAIGVPKSVPDPITHSYTFNAL